MTAILGGTTVFTRTRLPEKVLAAIRANGVTHLGAAPIVLQILAEHEDAGATPFDPPINVLTSGKPPPPSVLEKTRAMGLDEMQVCGLTETHGHISQCVWQEDWNTESPAGHGLSHG